MAKDKNGVAKHFTGPYEKWVLGLGGKYLPVKRPPHGSSPGGAVQYAAFATFSEAVTSADVDPQPKGNQKFQSPRFPTIWTPGGEPAKYTSFPLIVNVSGLDELEGLNRWVGFVEKRIFDRSNWAADVKAGIVRPVSLKYGLGLGGTDGVEKSTNSDGAAAAAQNLARPKPGIRLNVPIEEDALDAAFKQTRPEKIEALKKARAGKPANPRLVIMAVIDDNIAFAHANFRDRSGESRIESCWLQSAKPDPKGSHSVGFGRELFAEDIYTHLKNTGFDEASVYAGIEMSEADKVFGNPWRRFSTHGTHVLDIAAGHRHGAVSPNWPVPEGQDLDDVRIIAVQLPPSAIANTAGFGKEAYVLSAFHHIFQRADEIFEAHKVEKPEDQGLIVNFSFGITAGPDDGTNPVATAICELIKQRKLLGKPTYVYMPAGNTFSSALYGEVTSEVLQGKLEYSIPWRIQPNSRTSSHLELWFEDVSIAKELVLVEPGGTKLGHLVMDANEKDVELKLGGLTFGLVSYAEYALDRWHVVISLAPTEPEDSTLPAASAGLWQIRLCLKEATSSNEPLVRCRIQRNDSPFGYWTGARQSYFDDPADVRFGDRGELSEVDQPGAFVRRFGSLNGWAIGNEIWIVGGIVKDEEKPSPASAAGRLSPINKKLAVVDIGAPSDDSRHRPGRLAAGTMSGSVARISGTSVAAPYAARRTALMLLARKTPENVSDLDEIIPVQGNSTTPPHSQVRLGKVRLA